MTRKQSGRKAVINRQLEIVELRENALSAREKAGRARRMAVRVGNTPSARVLELHAAEFEARAAALDRDIEALEEQGEPRPGPTRAQAWRARAEEIRTAAGSMTSEAARSTLDRLARNYEAMADQAEGEASQ